MSHALAQWDSPWLDRDPADRRFRWILSQFLLIFLAFALIIPAIRSPEPEPEEATKPPEPAPRILLERIRQDRPAALPVPPPPRRKPLPKPAEKRPSPDSPADSAAQRKQARERASSSGLLKFSEQLAALRGASQVSRLERATVSRNSTQAAEVDRSGISKRATASSGGIETTSLGRGTGQTSLDGRQTAEISSPATAGRRENNGAGTSQSGRSDESIRAVMDGNKSAIFALYHRELRKDPTLNGKVTVQLTIEPSGAVSSAVLVSSELDNRTLENKLLAKIRTLIFGQQDVLPTKLNYSFNFLPY